MMLLRHRWVAGHPVVIRDWRYVLHHVLRFCWWLGHRAMRKLQRAIPRWRKAK